MPSKHPPDKGGDVIAFRQTSGRVVLLALFGELHRCLATPQNATFRDLYAAIADATEAFTIIDRGGTPVRGQISVGAEIKQQKDHNLLRNDMKGGEMDDCREKAAILLTTRVRAEKMAIPPTISLESIKQFISQKHAQQLFGGM
jgi:hypothetical protein